MEHAHGFFLMLRGTGLHHRADQHLQKPSAHGVNHHGNQQTSKWARQKIRQNSQSKKSRRRAHVGDDQRRPVSDSIHKSHGKQVHRQLDAEIKGHQQGNLGQRNPIVGLKRQKQQGHKVVDNRLHNIGKEAGGNGFVVSVFHKHLPTRFRISHTISQIPVFFNRCFQYNCHTSHRRFSGPWTGGFWGRRGW